MRRKLIASFLVGTNCGDQCVESMSVLGSMQPKRNVTIDVKRRAVVWAGGSLRGLIKSNAGIQTMTSSKPKTSMALGNLFEFRGSC